MTLLRDLCPLLAPPARVLELAQRAGDERRIGRLAALDATDVGEQRDMLFDVEAEWRRTVIRAAVARVDRPRSLDYRMLALAAASESSGGLPSGRGRAHAWEPVVRHVPLALAAREATQDSDADAYQAMRLQAEIARAWVSVLRHLLCRSPAELNALPLGGAGR